MSPKQENTAGAGDRADSDVVRAPQAAVPAAAGQPEVAPAPQAAAPAAAERRSGPPEVAPRQEIPGVTVPMPAADGVTVPPVGGSRTAEEADRLAHDTAAKAG